MKEGISNINKIKLIEDFASFIPFLYLLRNNSSIRNIVSIKRDYSLLKKNFSFLKENPINSYVKDKKVLIVSLSPFLYQVKTEAMLAKALQLAGCDIKVLTWSYFFWPKKYFKLFGINDFIYFDKYLKKTNHKDAESEITRFFSIGIGFQDIKKWRFKNCRIGQQVLSKISRRMHATPDVSNQNIAKLFKYYLRKQFKAIETSNILLDELRPDIMIFNEANDSVFGALFDLGFNKGIDIIQFVQPLRDDSLIFKRFNQESKGLHPNSISKSTFKSIKDVPWSEDKEKKLWQEFDSRYGEKWFLSQRNQIGTVKKEKKQILNQLGISNDKKIATVFSHVLWDANLFYGDDLFKDYEDWFVETIKAACSNSNLNWIIKMHPANTWKRKRDKVKGKLRENIVIEREIGELPSHIHLLYPETDINTLSLFSVIDYGITVRGTTGMELPCFGKPLFTAGTGRYSGLGFTIDSCSQQDYLDKLSRIQDFSPLTEEVTLLAKKHAYAVFIMRHWEMRSFKADFSYKKIGSHPLDHNLHPVIKNFKQLEEIADLKKFKDWVLNNKESDYLNDIN